MIELTSIGDGVLLPVQAQPNARQDGVVGIQNGRLKVAVTQAPEKGKANNAIIQMLAKWLGVRKSQVKLHRGQASSQKAFVISGVSLMELREKIAKGVEG